jgi:dihydroxy-acid dehydratase
VPLDLDDIDAISRRTPGPRRCNQRGLVVLRGNLAPDGAVVKVTATTPRRHVGPARVFDGEDTAYAAVTGGHLAKGDVVVGHVCPEAAGGGPLAGLRDGDVIRIDVPARVLEVNADLTTRTRVACGHPPEPGVLAKYAATVQPASRGATTGARP